LFFLKNLLATKMTIYKNSMIAETKSLIEYGEKKTGKVIFSVKLDGN